VLHEVGLEIQNSRLLGVLAEFGLQVDLNAQRARFPAALVERFVVEAEKHDWGEATLRVGASAGVYHGLYHDPVTGMLVPWTEETLAYYFALARHLEHADRS
jgi:hypothetical protein